MKDPTTNKKIICLSTIASRDWDYIPDYEKIPNGLLFYKRDQKIEVDPEGKSFSYKFPDSTLKLI